MKRQVRNSKFQGGFKAALFAAIVSVLPAAERAGDFAAALEESKKGGQDIAVLFHGSDWCLPGRPYADHWKSEAFLSAAGDDLLVLDIDRRESPGPDDEASAERNEACPVKPRSLPALALFDREGRLVALHEGTPALDGLGRPELAIRHAVELRKKRDEIWKRAAGERGTRKAGLLAQGLELIGLGAGPKGIYQPVIEEIRKADPDDRSGALGRFTFPGRKLLDMAVSKGKAGEFVDADAEIAVWLKKTQLAKSQRQEAFAARFALYQRWPEKKAELPAVLKEIERLDPKSDLGQAAAAYLELLQKDG